MPWNKDTLGALRIQKRLTQEELADRAHIHRVTVAKLEAGTVKPTVETLEALADALGVSVTALLKPGTPKGRGQ